MNNHCRFAVFVVALCLPLFSQAQVINNGRGAALFEPEVDVVNSGVLLDAQATVSHDRKYVTLTMRPQNAQLLALHQFAFQTGQAVQGIVGGVNPVVGGGAGAGANGNVGANAIPQKPNKPMRVAPGNGGVIILQRGITPLVAE